MASNRGRFWGADSDSESSDSSSSSSDGGPVAATRTGAGRQWAVDSDSDSSDSDERVVRSEKDKRFSAISKVCTTVANHLKIKDWTGVLEDIGHLEVELKNAKAVMRTSGAPPVFLRTLKTVSDAAAATTRQDQKSMSKSRSVAFVKSRKRIAALEKDYAVVLEKFVSGGGMDGDSSDSDSGSGSGSGSGSDSDDDSSDSDDNSDSDDDKSDSDEQAVVGGGGGDSDSSLWDSDSDDSSDSDDDEGLTGRARWVKRTVVEKLDKNDRRREKADKRQRAKDALGEAEEKVEASVAPIAKVLEIKTPRALHKRLKSIVAQRGRREFTKTMLLKHLEDLYSRARAFGPIHVIPVLMHVIAARFDLSAGRIDSHLGRASWLASLKDVDRLRKLLDMHPEIRLGAITQEDLSDIAVAEKNKKRGTPTGTPKPTSDDLESKTDPSTPVTIAGEGAEEEEEEDPDSYVPSNVQVNENGTTIVRVVGDLRITFQLLAEEYRKALQQTDQHSPEYVKRLGDEQSLIQLASALRSYFTRAAEAIEESNGSDDPVAQHNRVSAAKLALIWVELVSYKSAATSASLNLNFCRDAIYGTDVHPACRGAAPTAATDGAGAGAGASSAGPRNPGITSPATWSSHPMSITEPDAEFLDVSKSIKDLCGVVYQFGEPRDKTRAVLCHVFYLALHDQYSAARDLLLMSKQQETIGTTDESCQILFNRAMAQLGLCAFRKGLVMDCHNCLAEIVGTGRSKELLAQGMSNQRFHERDPELEKRERRRRMPYHQHINLELLDACHMVSAMLLEVPNIAAYQLDSRRRKISTSYIRQLDILEKRTFIGPPETTKDKIVLAGLRLSDGEWEKSLELLSDLRVWKMFTGHDILAEWLTERVKVVGLQTYLLISSSIYTTISLATLSSMFDLTEAQVYSVVSRMLMDRELQASWDQPTGTLGMHRSIPSKLQALALQFADNVAAFVDSNERALANKTGSDRGEDGRPRYRGSNHSSRFKIRGTPRYAPTGGRSGRPGGRSGGRSGYGNRRYDDRRR